MARLTKRVSNSFKCAWAKRKPKRNEAKMGSCSNSINYKELRKMAIAFAISRGQTEHIAEEFAQEWILQIYEKGFETKLEWCFIDFCRKEFGNTGANRSASGRARSYAERTFVRVEDQDEGGEDSQGIYRAP